MNVIKFRFCSPPAGGQSQHLFEHNYGWLNGIDRLCDCRQYYKCNGAS